MKKTIQITIILFFSSLTLIGQTKTTKKADTFFENLSYVKASEEYLKLSKENPTEHVLKRLGDSYYFNVKMKEASEAYAKLHEKHAPEDTEYLFKYAQALRATGNFKDSNLWMEKFHTAKKGDNRGRNFTNENAKLSDLKDNEPNYSIKNLKGINTEFSDFGVTEYGNTILFSSPRQKSSFVKTSHTRNDRDFLDIYKVIKTSADSLEVRPMFTDEINSKYHESSVTFSPDQKTMYFTRNNYSKGVSKRDKEGINRLKIYKSTWDKKEWGNVVELPFNSNEYSVGHPIVSNDGEKLYFASDMPGGHGETDIYVVDIKENGSFGEIQNLGAEVNTEGREMFPFISSEDILYFSSDGHFGIGALDIFSSKKENGVFKAPVNLKAPINSELDDFAFSINLITQKGYLSSNRKGGVGDDDIYSVSIIEEPCLVEVKGIVIDKITTLPIPTSKVILKTIAGKIVEEMNTDALGKFQFKAECDNNYLLIGAKDTYTPDQKTFVFDHQKEIVLELIKKPEIIEEVVELNENKDIIIKINPIYFDLDKSNIREDAVLELDKVVKVMKQHPKLTIRASSHTDARSKDSYNQSLSERRAKSTANYIVSKGINSNRIVYKGYGESRLTNNCVDNNKHTNQVKCTEDQHQANRRTEFVITSYNLSENTIHKNNLEQIKGTHKVVVKETLYSISRKYNIDVKKLKRLNNLNSNKINIGQILKLK